MNVYDFDNTLYDGESCLDFFLFCLVKKKSLIIYLPVIFYTAILYKINCLPIERLYNLAGKFSLAVVKNKDNSSVLVKEFWAKNKFKLRQNFLVNIENTDVIITASPSFLINEIKDKLKTKNIICSQLNIENGKFEFFCYNENKVKAFKEKYPSSVIENFYTDSFSDLPMMKISKMTFIIKKGKIIKKISNNEL